MRRLVLIALTLLLASCLPRTVSEGFGSYYPPSAPLDSIVEVVHAQYDTTRAYRHSISVELAALIREGATRHSVPLHIAYSLIAVESAFISDARSSAGALGLTQVMPATGAVHCGLLPADLIIPEFNIPCGFSYLSMLYIRLNSWPLALASYNVGDARRRRAPRTGESDGSTYARNVMRS